MAERGPRAYVWATRGRTTIDEVCIDLWSAEPRYELGRWGGIWLCYVAPEMRELWAALDARVPELGSVRLRLVVG